MFELINRVLWMIWLLLLRLFVVLCRWLLQRFSFLFFSFLCVFFSCGFCWINFDKEINKGDGLVIQHCASIKFMKAAVKEDGGVGAIAFSFERGGKAFDTRWNIEFISSETGFLFVSFFSLLLCF